MIRFVRSRLLAGTAAAAMVIAVVAAGAGAAAASPTPTPSPSPMAQVPVQQGTDVAALPGATVFGDTPPSTPEIVSFILRERNLRQLSASVEHGVRHFLSVRQFAGRYGQSRASIAQLTAYLAKFGISTEVYADRVDVVATGTAGQFDRALSVQQKQFHVPAMSRHGFASIPAQTVHGTSQSPMLPRHIARTVLAILGLTNYGPFSSQAMHVNKSVTRPKAGSANSCIALTGLAKACHLPSDFAAEYGLNPLYRKGATGAGQTLAIVTLAALDPGAPQFFWKHIAHVPASNRSVNVVNIDGGPGAPSDAAGSGETDLDVEQSGALAPGANVIVYQAPNSDPGFADAFFTAASKNTADTVSTSWGESETVIRQAVASGTEPPAYVAAFDEAYLELAIQGQSGFDSAGDGGAYDDFYELGTTSLSIDNPADSPFMTAAGGTTLPWTGQLTGPDGTATVTVPNERAWGWDYLWQATAAVSGASILDTVEANAAGTGGGFSVLEPTPSYQEGVPGTQNFHAVQYLTPTDFKTIAPGVVEPTAWTFNPTPGVSQGRGSGRAVPDLATNADPDSGYLLYEPSFAGVGQPVLQGGWGGTSFSAPQLNGSTAVIDSLLGHRVGLWNPFIYAFAAHSHSPFTPLQESGTGSDNLFYTGNPGQLFNEGTGLGLPDMSKLAADFARRS
jgi:subtilase family serine protease